MAVGPARALALGTALAFVACAGAKEPAAPSRLALKESSAPPIEAQPKDSVSREAVDTAVAGGLGKFLTHVEVDPELDDKGKFVGWRVVALHGDMWKGVDVQVGDVITRVNGFPIERDYQADKAFRSLGVASEIRVSMIRNGEKRELRFSIVG